MAAFEFFQETFSELFIFRPKGLRAIKEKKPKRKRMGHIKNPGEVKSPKNENKTPTPIKHGTKMKNIFLFI